MASSLAKEAESVSIVGSNRTSFYGGNRENEYSDGMPSTEERVCATKLICYEGG